MGSPLSEAWLEAQVLLMESLKSRKPLKKVSQADLDRALGDTQAPVPDTRSVAKSTGSIEKPSLVQGVPAGLESDSEVQSQLDDFYPEDEAYSDDLSEEDYRPKGPYITDEEEELVEQYI